MELMRKDEGFNGLFSSAKQNIPDFKAFEDLLEIAFSPNISKSSIHFFVVAGNFSKRLGEHRQKRWREGLWGSLQDLEKGLVPWAEERNRKRTFLGSYH